MSLPNSDSQATSILARFANPYRIAAYVQVFFMAGHTMGAVINIPKFGPASDVVVAAMQSVHVKAQGADATWYGFYRGFGLSVSVAMLLVAALFWVLGGLPRPIRLKLAPIGWILLVYEAAGILVAWQYFFPTPLFFSALMTVIVGVAVVRDWLAARQKA